MRFRARAQGALAMAAALAATAASAPAAPGATLPSVSDRQDAAAASGYWTARRMRLAIPAQAPAEPLALATGSSSLERQGKRLDIPPVPALAQGSGGNRASLVSNSGDVPYRAHGKVFFRSAGTDYVCSGTAVRSRNRSLVWTAGHCVHDSSGFVSRFVFIPAYRNGNAPFGRWSARRLFTTPGWAQGENYHYDVGAAKVEHHDGRALQRVAGARGITFDRPYDQQYTAFGYPAAPNLTTLRTFDGEREYRCTSGNAGRDDPGGDGPDTHAIRCDMTGGSSGGSWIVDGSYVNSNTSYGYQLGVGGIGLGDNLIYGPYFGSVIRDFYRGVRGRPR